MPLSVITTFFFIHCQDGDQDDGARIAVIDPRRPSYPLAPLHIDKAPLLDEWEVSANEVIVEQQLGEGAFGEVFKGAMKGPIRNPKISSGLKHTIGLPVAIKLLKRKLHLVSFGFTLNLITLYH